MRKFSALTQSLFGLHPGILGHCPTRIFDPELFTFEKLMNGELMKKSIGREAGECPRENEGWKGLSPQCYNRENFSALLV